jgi:antitoxin component YwqK of YwqJK toxin-antitoxin module
MDKYIVTDLIKYIICNYINYDHIIALDTEIYILNKNRISKLEFIDNTTIYIDNKLRIIKTSSETSNYKNDILHGFVITTNKYSCTKRKYKNGNLGLVAATYPDNTYTITYRGNYSCVKREYKKYHFYKDGKLLSVISYIYYPKNKKEVKDGTFFKFYPDGTIHVQGTYNLDELNGLYMVYYNNSKIKKKYNYDNGIKIWFCEEYYDNGNKKLEEQYSSNGMLLNSKGWYINGDLKHFSLLQLNDYEDLSDDENN